MQAQSFLEFLYYLKSLGSSKGKAEILESFEIHKTKSRGILHMKKGFFLKKNVIRKEEKQKYIAQIKNISCLNIQRQHMAYITGENSIKKKKK